MSAPSIYVFAGEDTYSSAQKVIAWKKKFQEKHGIANLQTIDCTAGDEQEIINQISQALRGGTLFSPVTLTILKGLWGQKSRAGIRDGVQERLSTLPSQAFLIIHDEKMDGRTSLCQTLKKLAKEQKAILEEFHLPRHAELGRWIDSLVKKNGTGIEQAAIHELIQRYDPEMAAFQQEAASPFNLWEVNMELKKLIAYAQGRSITAKDVALLTPNRADAHIFELTDALLNRIEKNARILFHNLSTQDRDVRGSLIGILSFLETQFRDALALRLLSEAGVSGNEIADTLSWNPKRVWVVQKKVAKHSPESLCGAYHRLLESEMQLKTKTSPLALMDTLITDLQASR